MTKRKIIEGYLAAEKPYGVYAHTRMGGYMEFMAIQCNIMFEDNARAIADSYAEIWRKRKSEDIKGICVRKNYTIVYEISM